MDEKTDKRRMDTIEKLTWLENILEYHHAKIYEIDDIKKIREKSTKLLKQVKKTKIIFIENLIKNAL